MKTRTGSFPIGFRRGGSEWQRNLDALINWAQEQGLEAIDVGKDGDRCVQAVMEAGLRIGSVDLSVVNEMISPDKGERKDAIAQNADYVRSCAAGRSMDSRPINFFLVMLPKNPQLPRAENFGYMVESFAELVPVLKECNARLVIEGWPGPGALCCTPEGYRALFQELPSSAVGINYDPSHLVRQGIDPLRFLREFVDRVGHVHGKDTELLSENLYEFGSEQPPTFAKRIPYGALHWRYTIPGQGCVRWSETLRILEANGYTGCVSIELEDANFNGTTEGEQFGILQGARFLEGC
jgi:sugar phosphate isomerase/epimerase